LNLFISTFTSSKNIAMDFTIEAYRSLLQSLIAKNYAFQTFQQFIESPKGRVVILRHDVDRLPGHSLRFAKIQHELGICGSYYFRMVSRSGTLSVSKGNSSLYDPKIFNPKIIKAIAALGHEIGYHYETMDTSSSLPHPLSNSHIKNAYDQFKTNLEKLRQVADIKTICMHGSPRSKFDNREIWKHYSYKELDIIGEPYFDVDFNKVFYLTDTGRRWDGHRVSVRDKMPQQEEWNRQGLRFRNTKEIISAINREALPNQIMFTFHPQRWNSSLLPWAKEFVWQNIKNVVKGIIIKN
jgi:hypothetical protein